MQALETTTGTVEKPACRAMTAAVSPRVPVRGAKLSEAAASQRTLAFVVESNNRQSGAETSRSVCANAARMDNSANCSKRESPSASP